MNQGRDSDSTTDRDGESSTDEGRRIIVISAPSGAGKTSIARLLLERFPRWRFSISATTRSRREHEVDGVDYYFLDPEEFRRRVERGEMVEWEEIYGNYYGTLRDEVARLLGDPEVEAVLFDVDVKGALSIRRAFPQETSLVYIAPPSIEVLEERLRQRNTETEETLARRIRRARMELEMQGEFEIIVVNDDLMRAFDELVETLVPAEQK